MSLDLEQILRPLLGSQISLEGRLFMLHDILVDEQSLVLLRIDQEGIIQTDQYGDPRRRIPEVLVIPFLDKETLKPSESIRYIIDTQID